MMYKLVVFDLDGTLCDTLGDLANAVNYSLDKEGLPTNPLDSYRRFVGNGVNKLIQKAMLSKGDDEELLKTVKSHFDSYYPLHLCDSTIAYSGINSLLTELERLGVMTAVNSNKPQAYVPVILDTLFKEHKFCIALGNRAEFERKPSPQALLKIIEDLNVGKEDVLYVGDSDVDIFTAHNGGVKACGVEWGFRGKDELVFAGADYIAKDSEQLLDIIKGIV